MRRFLASAVALAACLVGLTADPSPASAAPAAPVVPADDLTLTPPMGFNDWNAFGCNVSEELIT